MDKLKEINFHDKLPFKVFQVRNPFALKISAFENGRTSRIFFSITVRTVLHFAEGTHAHSFKKNIVHGVNFRYSPN